MRAAAAILLLALAVGVCAPSSAAAVDSYAFTDAACVKGKAFGSKQQTCNLFAGPVLAGDSTNVFVTALSGGVPTEFSSSSTTTVSMAFALSCINPSTHANVRATYAGQSLQLCKANGATPGLGSSDWSGFVNVGFGANSPSASATLVYGDVGQVKLFVRTSTGTISGSGPFVAKPAFLKITSVSNVADGFANPKSTTGSGTLFARAGQPLKITAEAQTTGGIAAPNFGSENMILVLDSVPAGGAAEKTSMLAAPKMVGDFTSIVGGVSAGSAFSVNDAGIIAITPSLCDNSKPRPCVNSYLDAGPAAQSETVVVGRIYPDHFDTAWVDPARMACLPHMYCPAGVDGAEYSGHIRQLTVTPMSAQGQPLKNFNGVFARAITLSAFTQLGGATANTAGTLTGNSIALAAIKDPIVASPAFTFPQPFSNTKPQLGTWGVPSAVFVRAESSDTVGGASNVSSLRPAAASKEAGMMIITGRLALASQYGSELAKMPVRAVAQYWTGAKRWEPNISDSVSSLASGGIVFSNCTKALAGSCGGPTLAVSPAGTLLLKDGAATFWLQAPGAGKTGSADFQMNNPPDLPSTMGRAAFGIYKSPLIYVREVY